MDKVGQEINAFASRVEKPLAIVLDRAQVAELVDEKAAPLLSPLGVDRNGSRLVAVAGMGLVLLLVSKALGPLQIFVQLTSLALAARNSIVAIETTSKDSKPLLM